MYQCESKRGFNPKGPEGFRSPDLGLDSDNELVGVVVHVGSDLVLVDVARDVPEFVYTGAEVTQQYDRARHHQANA